MQTHRQLTPFSDQDLADLATDLESLQGTIAQFFADKERGFIQLQTIQEILQLANHLIDFYDD
jgi:hypothetical protein